MRFKDAVYPGLLLTTLLLLGCIVWKPSRMPQQIRQIILPPKNLEARHELSQNKCGLLKCPPDHFAFHLRTGMANVVGPQICFRGKMIMSHVHNNIYTGLNIVLVNGESGEIEKMDSFNMYFEKVDRLLFFLKEIKTSTIVLLASFDDPATTMTEQIREVFASLGSSAVQSLMFRDGWVFVGSGGIKGQSPFEKVAKNNVTTNVYDGWPGATEVGGCIPRVRVGNPKKGHTDSTAV